MADKKKPGYKTTEFYLSLASVLIGALLASGVLGEGTEYERIGGMILSLLASAGYGMGRTMLKGK